jgi:hypothetical protein
MANPTGKDVAIKVDSGGSPVDLTSHLNSASLSAVQSILEDSALGDDERTYVHGLAGASFSLGGFYNSTTEAAFGPLLGNRTSISTTVEYRPYSGRFYNGEALITNIQLSGAPDTLETFSADGSFTGAINRTTASVS